jgi:hypothetical protein
MKAPRPAFLRPFGTSCTEVWIRVDFLPFVVSSSEDQPFSRHVIYFQRLLTDH